jgi:hypothetical protein
VVERGTGRVLGPQIGGNEGAAMRIDVPALGVWNAMTGDEVLSADLSYAPRYSPVWEPGGGRRPRAAEQMSDAVL